MRLRAIPPALLVLTVPALASAVGGPAPSAAPAPLPPLPTTSATAPSGSAAPHAPAPPASAPAPAGSASPAGPPPYMVEEPYTPPPAEPPPAPAGQPGQRPQRAAPPHGYPPPAYTPGYPPPPSYPSPYAYPYGPYGYGYPPPPPGYVYEPPPPPPVRHRAPSSSLWLGGRLGGIAPVGRLYYYGVSGYYYDDGPGWSDVASPGLSLEGDIGGRFARRFVVYGFLEHARFGAGGASLSELYTQNPAKDAAGRPVDASGNLLDATTTRATSTSVGVALRWTSSPDDVGLLVDVGLGYRWADVRWSDGSHLAMSSPFEVRLGIGADIRLSRSFALSPELMFTNGVFSDAKLDRPGLPRENLGNVAAGHGTVGLQLGGHFDLAPSRY